MSLVAVLGLLLAALLVGGLVRGSLMGAPDTAPERAIPKSPDNSPDNSPHNCPNNSLDDILAGLLILHLLLVALDLALLPWSGATVLLPFAALALMGAGLRWRRGFGSWRGMPRPGWGDIVALFSLAALALLALERRIAASDFIYHWGLKGKRFALAHGIDYELLTIPTNFYLHPDYPNLVPEAFAVLDLMRGRFDESAMLLFTVCFYGLALLAIRTLLCRLDVAPPLAQAGLALNALALLSFAVSWQLTGNADILVTLAVLVAALALLEAPTPAGELRIGLAAAFAAAVKIEGIALAAFVVAVYGVERLWRRELKLRGALRVLAPLALVVGPWALQVWRYDLRQELYTGSYEAGRLGVVLRQALDISLNDGWHGISLLALVLLPLLFCWRRSRLLATLIALQLGFFLFAYLTAPVDTVLLVRSSFPRLMMHVVPLILVLAVAALDAFDRRPGRSVSR